MTKKNFVVTSDDDRLDNYIKSINDKDAHRNKKDKNRRKDKDYFKKYERDDYDRWN